MLSSSGSEVEVFVCSRVFAILVVTDVVESDGCLGDEVLDLVTAVII